MDDLDALLADLQSTALPTQHGSYSVNSSDSCPTKPLPPKSSTTAAVDRSSTASDRSAAVGKAAGDRSSAGSTAVGGRSSAAGDRSSGGTTAVDVSSTGGTDSVVNNNTAAPGHSPGSRVVSSSSTTMYHTITTTSTSEGIYECVNDLDIQPMYETRRSAAKFSPVPHDSSPRHTPVAHSDPPIYAQTIKQQMRSATAAGSAQGTGSSRNVSTLSSNLSELDSLLQELSAAQFSADIDKRDSAGLSTNRSDSSCSPGSADKPAEELAQQHGRHERSGRQGTAASSATRELDDLMASLSGLSATEYSGDQPSYRSDGPAVAMTSDVRRQNNSQDEISFEQALPKGGGGSSVVQPTVNQATTAEVTTNKLNAKSGNNLNEMMQDLDKNMTQQGVTTVPKGHCAACTKPIVGQVITALARLWHPEHFTCAHCREQIGTRNFFERDALPYCERDYHLLFSPRCAYCSGPILDKCVTAMDKTWHPEHFCCVQCGKQLGDVEGFQEKDGQAYCREDYFQQFAPKCGGCSQPIMESFITALSQQWHPQCFVCMECRMPFGASSFFDHDGLPYCETHFHAKRGSLCASCHKPVAGRCITAMYKKFHPEHFVCTYCQKQLNKGTFKEQNDKPYCHPCFVHLFG